MIKKNSRLAFVISLFLVIGLVFSACDQLDNLGIGKNGGLDVPSMVDENEKLSLEKDNKGLDKVDHQYLAYAKEKWGQFEKALDAFGEGMDTYLDKVFEKAEYIEDQKEFIKTRKDLLTAIRNIERVDPSGLPKNFENLYQKLYLAANRARYMIHQAQQNNAATMPGDFEYAKEEIAPFKQSIEQFFAEADSAGLDTAVANILPTDWTAEANRSRELNNRNTFNVADYGLKWGSSRWDVMGVEGMQEGGYNKEVLSYETVAYRYDSVRNYHFNEYGQLDYYTYDVDGSTHDRGVYDDPLFDDIYELSPIIMYHFVRSGPALPVQPQNDGVGNLSVSFDLPAETVLLYGAVDGTITVTVTGKTVE